MFIVTAMRTPTHRKESNGGANEAIRNVIYLKDLRFSIVFTYSKQVIYNLIDLYGKVSKIEKSGGTKLSINVGEDRGKRQLDTSPMSPLQKRAAILVALGEFVDGYDLLVIGAALIVLRPAFHLSAADTGLLGAASFLGAIIGLMIFGDLSDRIGRRAIFVVNLVFFVVFSLISAFVTNTPELFIVRFLVGVGIGMDIPTSTAYLAEVSPKNHRGKVLGSLPQITWVLGALASTLVAIPLVASFGNEAWRWMFGLAAIPAALVLLGRQFLPESPRWLASRGRTSEAEEVLRSFGVAPTPPLVGSFEGSETITRGTGYGALLRSSYQGRAWWVSAIFFLNCFSGPIATVATPYIVRYVGAVSVNQSLIFSGWIWMADLAGAFGSFFLIDRIGRKRLAYIGLIPSGVLAVLMGIFAEHNAHVLLGLFFLFGFFNWLAAPALQWAWSSELFPTSLRGKSQGFCNGWCRFAIALNIFLVPVALATIGFRSLLITLSIPLFLYALIVWRKQFFDSGRVSLEEISPEYGVPSNR